MTQKERIDVILVDKGFFSSRERARAAIMAGIVLVNNQRIDKSGSKVDVESEITIKGQTLKYVSRGGLKLEKALGEFSLSIKDNIAMDIGCSTGGFTDCMLQNGAKKVYAIDVGYGQLDWSLRQDSRVVVMERTNFRYLTKENISEEIDFATIDVSFISLTKILPNLIQFLSSQSKVVALIKPQFEAGRDKVGKKGVVKDKTVHFDVIKATVDFASSIGYCPRGLSFSPIKGPEGNIEYLLYLDLDKQSSSLVEDSLITQVVEQSHLI